MKSTKNHKKEDGTFHSKKIKHDPQAESARAVFGLKYNNEENSNYSRQGYRNVMSKVLPVSNITFKGM